MQWDKYHELVTSGSDSSIAVSNAEQCARLLGQLTSLRSWVESRMLAVTRRLDQLAATNQAMFPEQVVAEATRVSLSQALQPFRRVKAVELLPELGAALAAGTVNIDHVDVLARAVAGVDAATRQRLADRGDFLTEVASRTTSTEFGRTLRTEIRRAQADDGIARLEQQRRNSRLRTWVDRETGMWCLRGELDPESGALLDGRLRNAVEALFHDALPGTCPADPLEKQHHLRALALMSLTEGKNLGRAGTIDVSILIDAATLADGLHDDSVLDCGLPIDLPVETIRRMACCADITPVIVGADGVRLELGRTTRLANRAQRRALRAMYRGCAVPGCSECWSQVVIHHLRFFRSGGATDVQNLLPLCTKHHHLVHEGGWKLSLDPRRNLTIERADGSTMTTGPPKALAA